MLTPGLAAAIVIPLGASIVTFPAVGMIVGCAGTDSPYVPWAPSPRHTYPRSSVIVSVLDTCGGIRRVPVTVFEPPTA